MIDPRTVVVAIPCYSGRNVAELTGSIWTWQGLFSALSIPIGCSHPSLARNLIAAQFLATQFEWLICIDDDIYPTRHDLELLLQPTDPQATYFEQNPLDREMSDEASRVNAPQPTRIAVALVEDGQRDLNRKQTGMADVLVNAEYCYKDDELRPVKFGMGFTRIHRSVFRTLEALTHEPNPSYQSLKSCAERLHERVEGLKSSGQSQLAELIEADAQTIEQHLPDPGGGPRLFQVQHKGKLYTDFFPSGPLISQFVPTAEWKGEDHGFFTLAMLAGIVPRIETRTRLIHIGTKGFRYEGPDTGLVI